jgi:hypothetical protein
MPWKKVPYYEPLDDGFIPSLPDVIAARTHQMRERIIWWVLVPLLGISVLSCLLLVVLSAFACIGPLSQGLLWICGVVLGGNVMGAILGAGFGWLFDRTSIKTLS